MFESVLRSLLFAAVAILFVAGVAEYWVVRQLVRAMRTDRVLWELHGRPTPPGLFKSMASAGFRERLKLQGFQSEVTRFMIVDAVSKVTMGIAGIAVLALTALK